MSPGPTAGRGAGDGRRLQRGGETTAPDCPGNVVRTDEAANPIITIGE